jgi:phosphoribosyl 1,2-cyclic phosphodiesterase
MAVQFAVLASGSRGNSTFIRSHGAGLILDLGIGQREMTRRLESVGASWQHVGAALLTHTHSDHVDDHGLNGLARQGIPFYCHEGHRAALSRLAGFRALDEARLVRCYDDRPFLTPAGMGIEPVELRHDGGPTFGFRIEARAERRGPAVAIGYLADTGCWSDRMADQLAEVDVLGVEFNHDVEMQKRSRRPPILIERNLGDWGHLSNDQGAELVTAVLGRSGRGRLRHLVLLHLSEQCNRPDLALQTARAAVRGAGRKVTVYAACQSPAHPTLWLEPARRRWASLRRSHARVPAAAVSPDTTARVRQAPAASWFSEDS